MIFLLWKPLLCDDKDPVHAPGLGVSKEVELFLELDFMVGEERMLGKIKSEIVVCFGTQKLELKSEIIIY